MPLFFGKLDRMGFCFFTLGDSDFLFCNHPVDGVIPTKKSAVGMQYRRVVRWGTRDRRQHGSLFDIQVLELLTEEEFGGCSKSVLTVSHEMQVAIHGQDLLFCIEAFDLNGQHCFLDLSPKGPFWR